MHPCMIQLFLKANCENFTFSRNPHLHHTDIQGSAEHSLRNATSLVYENGRSLIQRDRFMMQSYLYSPSCLLLREPILAMGHTYHPP